MHFSCQSLRQKGRLTFCRQVLTSGGGSAPQCAPPARSAPPSVWLELKLTLAANRHGARLASIDYVNVCLP